MRFFCISLTFLIMDAIIRGFRVLALILCRSINEGISMLLGEFYFLAVDLVQA